MSSGQFYFKDLHLQYVVLLEKYFEEILLALVPGTDAELAGRMNSSVQGSILTVLFNI